MSVADLRRGQERYRRQQRQEAIRRVVVYQRWLANGSRLRDIPPIPTNRDYAVARAAGKVK